MVSQGFFMGVWFKVHIVLPVDSYTHISEAWHTTSWLDHCLTTADAHASLAHMEILYDVSTSDHIPVKMVIRSEYIPSTIKCENNSNHVFLDWSSLTCEEMSLYYEHTDQLLNNIYLPREALMCKNGNYTNSKHIIDISAMYTAIVSALLEASKSLLKHKKGGKTLPGWNAYVAEFYAEAREATRSWAMAGKPRQGPIFEYKKSTNAKCKYAIRFISKN